MSQPITSDPTKDDSDQASSPLPGKKPEHEPPMEPNPYMGGGTAPA